MTLRLERGPVQADGTFGHLVVDGAPFCETLENPPGKDKGPVPAGRYDVTLTFSERFQRKLPLLADVPGFTGVRLHPGNTEADTTGCILLGRWSGYSRTLEQSRSTMGLLLSRWTDPATIEI